MEQLSVILETCRVELRLVPRDLDLTVDWLVGWLVDITSLHAITSGRNAHRDARPQQSRHALPKTRHHDKKHEPTPVPNFGTSTTRKITHKSRALAGAVTF